MVIALGSVLFCAFYAYVFMKFAAERDSVQILKRQVAATDWHVS